MWKKKLPEKKGGKEKRKIEEEERWLLQISPRFHLRPPGRKGPCRLIRLGLLLGPTQLFPLFHLSPEKVPNPTTASRDMSFKFFN